MINAPLRQGDATRTRPARPSLDPESRPGPATSQRFVFQRLVADLAARFAVTQAEEIDRAVSDSLREIGEVLALDCIVLWEYDVRHAALAVTHRWSNGADVPGLAESWPAARIPYTISALEGGQAVSFSRVNEIGNPIDRDAFVQTGLDRKSVV